MCKLPREARRSRRTVDAVSEADGIFVELVSVDLHASEASEVRDICKVSHGLGDCKRTMRALPVELIELRVRAFSRHANSAGEHVRRALEAFDHALHLGWLLPSGGNARICKIGHQHLLRKTRRRFWGSLGQMQCCKGAKQLGKNVGDCSTEAEDDCHEDGEKHPQG